MSLHQQMIGIRISGNSEEHIQTTITHSISIKKKKKCKICVQIEALNEYFLKQTGRV